MLRKILLVGAVVGGCTMMTAVGCSSSSNGASGNTEDSGTASKDGGSSFSTRDSGTIKRDGGTTIVTDGGNITHPIGSSDGGPITFSDGGTLDAPACYDVADSVSLTGVAAPAAHQNVCTSTQISGFMTACVGSSATTTTCDTFQTANATCTTCLAGPSTSGATGYAYPATVPLDSSGDVIPNTAGCFAALSTGDAACKLSFTNEQLCEQSACASCDDTTDSACLSYADADSAGCPSLSPTDATCLSALDAAQASSANQTACASTATDFATAYAAIAATLCGAP